MPYITHEGSAGKPGAHGNKITTPPPQSEVGQPGEISVESGENVDRAIGAPLLSLLQGRILLRKILMEHLNENVKEALDKLGWLCRLLGIEVDRSKERSRFDLSGPVSASPSEAFNELRQQAAIQLMRIERGLDRYGNVQSYVPLVTFTRYKSYVEALLKSATDAESRYAIYFNQSSSDEEKMTALRAGLTSLEHKLIELEEAANLLAPEADSLQNEIAKLLWSMQTAAQVLLSTATEFQNAMKRKANGCGLPELIKGVGAIVAIGSGGAAALAGVGPLVDVIKREDVDFFDHMKLISKHFEPVKKGFAELQKGYNAIKPLLEDTDIPELPSDNAKLIAERDDIVESIEPFKDLAEAEEYINAIDHFIELSLLRNEKIKAHDTILLQILQYQSDYRGTELELADVDEQLARTPIPELPEFVEFMHRTLNDYKEELVRSIYFEGKALYYTTLNPLATEIRRDTIAHIESAHQRINRLQLEAAEEQGRSHQIMSIDNPFTQFRFSEIAGEEAIVYLRERRSVTFQIPKYRLADFQHVYATRARLTFEGLPKSPPVMARLTHLGNAYFVDEVGREHYFVHKDRKTDLTHPPEMNGSSLGGDSTFVSISPYGPWELTLNLSLNRNADLSGITDVVLSFELRTLPL